MANLSGGAGRATPPGRITPLASVLPDNAGNKEFATKGQGAPIASPRPFPGTFQAPTQPTLICRVPILRDEQVDLSANECFMSEIAMEPLINLGTPVEDAVVAKLLCLYEVPAFLRRAQRAQEAIEQVRRKATALRRELLAGVRLRLRLWNDHLAAQPRLATDLAEDARSILDYLDRIAFERHERRRSMAGPGWPALPGLCWRGLRRAVHSFNQRWPIARSTVELDRANREIDGYNRHYVFEKECALRSARLARLGFQAMAPLTLDWLAEEFPLLPPLPRHWRLS